MAGSDRDHPEDRAQEIFEQISELPPEAQERRVEELCEDEEVRLEVERMLEAYGRLQEMMAVLDEVDPRTVTEDDESTEPERIDRFELLERAGEGGMGVVYRARDTQLDRVVALKLLPDRFGDDRTARQRFLREAQTASQLDHPNVAPLHEYGETDDGRTYLVMPFYEGDSLEDRLADGPLELNDALDVATQLCEGLAAAHDEGIVHRDVKPGNILLPNHQPVKLVDFGLAKWTGETAITRTDSVLGSVAYMSPEQLQGQALDERTDVWSLGVVLYEMLTGERPFDGRYPEALAYEIINGEHEPPSDRREAVTDEIDAIIGRCLAKDPTDRYASVGALASDLTSVREESEAPSRSSSSKEKSSDPIFSPVGGSFNRVHGIAAAAGTLLVAALLWSLLVGGFAGGAVFSSGDTSDRIGVFADPDVSLTGEERAILRDLSVNLTSLLTEVKSEVPDAPSVIPASQMAEVSSVKEARRMADASRVISVHLLDTSDDPRLQLSLIDVRDAEQLNTAQIRLDSSGSTGRATQLAPTLAELLDLTLPNSFYEKLAQNEATDSKAAEYYERGRQALEEARESGSVSGATDTAVKFFQMARRADSSFPEAYVGLANAYWLKYRQDGDSSAARRARSFERKAQNLSDRDDPGVYVRRGNLNLLRGHYERALVDFRFAVGLDSSNVEARLGLARARQEVGLFQQAEQTFKSALDLAPDNWRVRNRLGLLYLKENRYEEAAEQFRTIIADDSSNVTGHLNLGIALDLQGHSDRAINRYRKALSISDISPVQRYRALTSIGTVRYYQNQFMQAARSYERALQIDSTREKIWGNLAYTYRELNRDSLKRWAAQNAAERTGRDLTVNPDDPAKRVDLGTYLAMAGRPGEAREQLRKARELRPDAAHTIFSIGYAYELIGDRELAIDLIVESLEEGFSMREVRNRPELQELVKDPRFHRHLDDRTRLSLEDERTSG